MENKKPEWYKQAGKEPFKQNHFHGNLSTGVKSRIEKKKYAPSRIRWYTGGAVAAVVVALIAISSFLSNGGSDHTPSPNQTPAAQTKGPSLTNPTSKLSNVPITKDWEKNVKNENVFSSTASNVSWLLLTSEPAAGQMGKTLYKSEDNGKSWVFVNDVSQIVDGYVTGISFRDDQNGWISATQHGAALVPLYRTKDGGKTWSIQAIAIPAGYKYGNVYPPVFNEKDTMQGTLKIEFVSDTDKKTMKLTTTDGGETWRDITAPSPVVVGTSASCDTPPQQLQLSGKTYQLKSGEASGEPAMKLAYFKCDKGMFTLGDAEDPYSVSYAGDPAKNNGEILVMGNWGGTGTWSQASYSLVTPQTSSSTDSVYKNTQYGFQFSLPERWKGYSIITSKWEGFAMDGDRGEKVVDTGPLISIRDPEWTAQTPKQDIPIMVFTLSQWDSLQQGVFHIGAAPVGPSELGRNDTYVFALPARYNSALLPGYEEVEKILESKPLKALKSE